MKTDVSTADKPPCVLGSHIRLNDGVTDQFDGEIVAGDVATVLQTVTDEDGDLWVWSGGRYLCRPE